MHDGGLDEEKYNFLVIMRRDTWTTAPPCSDISFYFKIKVQSRPYAWHKVIRWKSGKAPLILNFDDTDNEQAPSDSGSFTSEVKYKAVRLPDPVSLSWFWNYEGA